MKHFSKYVNVFQGSGKVELPKPEGIAATWFFIKAQCGNTIPAAAYPFGRMTLCTYTGAYPTGYGNHYPNSFGEPQTFDAKAQGFSHMHVSGTGGIRAYYNFALTSPIIGDKLRPMNETLIREIATPGYYSAELSSGVGFEGTVSQKVAYHRYRFPDEGLLQIDFSNCGLDRRFKGYFFLPEEAEISIISATQVCAHAKMQGIDLYFAAECPTARGVRLWQDYIDVCGDHLTPTDLRQRFGAAFSVSGTAEMRMAISFISCESALSMFEGETDGFDTIRANTISVWDKYLGRIEIETDNDELREIFYSNLYHTLIKPCNGCGESFLYDINESNSEFYFDLATLWDMYKTALPLIFTLYPKEALGISETLLSLIDKYRRSPINVTVSANNDFTDQARMLAEHSLADFYFRGGEKYAERILEAAKRDLATHTDFLESGYCQRYTHILDVCEALGAMAQIADEMGKDDLAEHFRSYSLLWKNAYDKDTGLLSEKSPYYEGTNKNYSFRLLRNTEERIGMMGTENYLQELDELFGYTRDAVERPTNPYRDPMALGINSFEGFNNESDMEAPYAYLYANRHDRVCEILRAGMKYMFTTGRGGLPGNNDSGGLSSCYIWNALGLFPVSGQDLILIGSPIIEGASLKLANDNSLQINVYGNSNSSIYVKKAVFNGKEIKGYKVSVRDIMRGGILDIYMDNSPCL